MTDYSVIRWFLQMDTNAMLLTDGMITNVTNIDNIDHSDYLHL